MEISRKKVNKRALVKILTHSNFTFEENYSYIAEGVEITSYVAPDVFTTHFDYIKTYQQVLLKRINESTKGNAVRIKILPDPKKLTFIDSQVLTITTEWEEINGLQQILIQSLSKSSHTTDFQNIGNTSRTIMDKLAGKVFDSTKHKPKDGSIKVANGFFKNQLHSYIDTI